MARLIQETIKKPLADEVLFGKLKAGGHVKVVVGRDDESGLDRLNFEYVDGPVTPKPEKIPETSGAKQKRRAPRRKPSRGGDNGPPSPRGSVPKVPLVKV